MADQFGGYQNEIYLQGLGGQVPMFTTNGAALEEAAREKMAPESFGYVVGGAGSGATVRANRDAFDRWQIVPRMLTDATKRELSTTVLGTDMPVPVMLAPVGLQSIVHPEGERATARAAASLGVPMVLSMASSFPLEEVAESNGDGQRWFQLYWPNDNDVTVSVLSRAKAAGYTALMVTLDTWTLGWRTIDLDRAYLPFLRGIGVANAFSDPAFRAGLAKPPEEDQPAAILHWIPMFTGTDKRWDQLPFLREHWDGPIVLKGIQHVDDARRAADAGMDGIAVSNHGGRQLDGAIGSLDALPEIAAAVGDRMAVLFDSGIRTGADIVKALALGADAVMVGRSFVYGLAMGGEDGVRHAFRSLVADLDLTLGLSGHRSPAELSADTLRRV